MDSLSIAKHCLHAPFHIGSRSHHRHRARRQGGDPSLDRARLWHIGVNANMSLAQSRDCMCWHRHHRSPCAQIMVAEVVETLDLPIDTPHRSPCTAANTRRLQLAPTHIYHNHHHHYHQHITTTTTSSPTQSPPPPHHPPNDISETQAPPPASASQPCNNTATRQRERVNMRDLHYTKKNTQDTLIHVIIIDQPVNQSK